MSVKRVTLENVNLFQFNPTLPSSEVSLEITKITNLEEAKCTIFSKN